LSKFQIAETKTFAKNRRKIDDKVYSKIVQIVYPQLRDNPFFGTNIKKLKGNLEGYYRYRIGSYRLFYLIDNKRVLVAIVGLQHRQSAYS